MSIAHKTNQYREEEVHICTGVLITNKFVLTAAHCFDGISSGEIQLIAGSVDLQKGYKYDISTWITYNQWAESKNILKSNNTHDIAMAKVTTTTKTHHYHFHCSSYIKI